MSWDGDSFGHSVAQRKRRRKAYAIANSDWSSQSQKDSANEYLEKDY